MRTARPLRLVGEHTESNPIMGEPIDGPTDPRWVLAIRTSESLEGQILRPERRERLIRLGKVMGLTPFDCNLIIAIVQDQARRGNAPEFCAQAGQEQLVLVPLRNRSEPTRAQRRFQLAAVVSLLLLAELLILRLLL